MSPRRETESGGNVPTEVEACLSQAPRPTTKRGTPLSELSQKYREIQSINEPVTVEVRRAPAGPPSA